jgi:hypothetical protein
MYSAPSLGPTAGESVTRWGLRTAVLEHQRAVDLAQEAAAHQVRPGPSEGGRRGTGDAFPEVPLAVAPYPADPLARPSVHPARRGAGSRSVMPRAVRNPAVAVAEARSRRP